MSSTSAKDNHLSDNTSTTLEPKEYWKIHAFFPVIDTIICIGVTRP